MGWDTLQEMIAEAAEADITSFRTVVSAEKVLGEYDFDFAFLDVNVTDDKTYSVATCLKDRRMLLR